MCRITQQGLRCHLENTLGEKANFDLSVFRLSGTQLYWIQNAKQETQNTKLKMRNTKRKMRNAKRKMQTRWCGHLVCQRLTGNQVWKQKHAFGISLHTRLISRCHNCCCWNFPTQNQTPLRRGISLYHEWKMRKVCISLCFLFPNENWQHTLVPVSIPILAGFMNRSSEVMHQFSLVPCPFCSTSSFMVCSEFLASSILQLQTYEKEKNHVKIVGINQIPTWFP